MNGSPRWRPWARARVLDLACGSGPLLELLHGRDADLRLTGADMCPEELALARRRMPEDAAELLQTEAQDMAALPTGRWMWSCAIGR